MINLPAPREIPTEEAEEWQRWWLDMLSAIAVAVTPLDARVPYTASATVTILAGTVGQVCSLDVPPLINDINLVDYVASSASGTKIPQVLLKKGGVLIDTAELGSLVKYLDGTNGRVVTYTLHVDNSGGGVNVSCSGAINATQF